MKKPISESFRITEDDFVCMSAALAKYRCPKMNKIIFRIMGIIAVACGAAAFINIRDTVYHTICWFLLIAIGMYVFSYYDVIDPFLMKSQAQQFYRSKGESLNSKTAVFGEERFELRDEEHTITIPWQFIYSVVEGKDTILVFVDMNEYCFIPKRVLDDDKLSLVKRLVGEDKYITL